MAKCSQFTYPKKKKRFINFMNLNRKAWIQL